MYLDVRACPVCCCLQMLVGLNEPRLPFWRLHVPNHSCHLAKCQTRSEDFQDPSTSNGSARCPYRKQQTRPPQDEPNLHNRKSLATKAAQFGIICLFVVMRLMLAYPGPSSSVQHSQVSMGMRGTQALCKPVIYIALYI